MIKVLVADDDADVRELLSYNLIKEGYEVETVDNGSEVLAAAQKFKPEMIILDIMLPGKDGVEVCEQLRMKKQFDNTFIVFLTALSEDFTQIACYENGGDDFIIKPIKPKVLMSRIKSLLRRKMSGIYLPEDSIVIGDLKIEVQQMKVTVKDKDLRLPKKEFELLSLLASKPGKLFTREEIFNKVWGAELMIGDRTIDVHIRKIREKIGEHFIQTIKGVGYKLLPQNNFTN